MGCGPRVMNSRWLAGCRHYEAQGKSTRGLAMYGFLILLPLTIISVLIGAFILLSPQLTDYVAFITEVNKPEGKTLWQHFIDNKPYWTRTAAHLVAYVIVCFVLTATVRTVSNPLPRDRPAVLRFFQMALEAIFVAVPTLVLLWI